MARQRAVPAMRRSVRASSEYDLPIESPTVLHPPKTRFTLGYPHGRCCSFVFLAAFVFCRHLCLTPIVKPFAIKSACPVSHMLRGMKGRKDTALLRHGGFVAATNADTKRPCCAHNSPLQLLTILVCLGRTISSTTFLDAANTAVKNGNTALARTSAFASCHS